MWTFIRTLLRVSLGGMLFLSLSAAPTSAWASMPSGTDNPGLSSFANDAELRTFLQRAREAEELNRSHQIPSPAPPAPGAYESSGSVAPNVPSITNNQIADVDEGDIVKQHGDLLVVLRRGRLFTVSLKDRGMKPIAMIDAFPPGVDARSDWYDEMLISGERIIVIGYSYARGGTQLVRFRIGEGGTLAFEDAYQLRSNDYFSSRNYASRQVGQILILYSPMRVAGQGDPLDTLPALRRWQSGSDGQGEFRRIVGAGRVFIPEVLRKRSAPRIDTLHAVTRCDLSAPVLDCTSMVVLGRGARSFFVSRNAIYLWTDFGADLGGNTNAMLYRISFDDRRPSAVRAAGAPIDQFSFHPDTARGMLHVLVRTRIGGDAMWRPEISEGSIALVSIPMGLFGEGRELPPKQYRLLPAPKGDSSSFKNRFIGDRLLYGGTAFGTAGPQMLYVAPLNGGAVATVALSHQIERIEPIGEDAMIVGSSHTGLGLTSVVLSATPHPGDTFILPATAQGESRSHGFFFSPDPGSADGSGMMGIPVAREIQPPQSIFFGRSASISFFARRGGRLARAGELSATPSYATDERADNCQASCMDWYGNARPIFIGDRIFALLGYQLIEGTREAQVHELGSVGFGPISAPRD